jgi:hypothetical protein
MSVDHKYFNEITLPQDNNCLFRSIVVFQNNKLLKCRRSVKGIPANKTLLEYENNCTQFLRSSVVRMIKSRKLKYSTKDFYDNKLYDSIDHRIEKMSQEGEFAGKLEMDILARMYKVKIYIFIEFNDEYSCIYSSCKEANDLDSTSVDLNSVFDDSENEQSDPLDYSEGNHCFLLLNNNHYSILEPNYDLIKMDGLENKESLFRRSENNDNVSCNEVFDGTENELLNAPKLETTPKENVMITIRDKRPESMSKKSSYSSLLNSSATSSDLNYDEDDYEKVYSEDLFKFNEKLRRLINDKKNGILLHTQRGSKLLELRENYREINFNDLLDIVLSIEN